MTEKKKFAYHCEELSDAAISSKRRDCFVSLAMVCLIILSLCKGSHSFFRNLYFRFHVIEIVENAIIIEKVYSPRRKMRKIASITILLLIAIAAFAAHETSSFSDEPELFRKISASELITYPPVQTWTLNNGLVVLFWENHIAPVVSMRIGVKTGSQYEGRFLGAGISHNLEHVVSGGSTSRMSESEYNQYLASIGATANAYTTRTITCYYINGPSGEFSGELMSLSDWVTDCGFDETELAREKGVITQEIYKGFEEPSRVMFDILYKTAFQNHPARYPVIGYLDNFLRISRDDLIEYYNSFYSPDNAILTLAGDISLEDAQTYTDSLFGDWERRTHQPPLVTNEPAQLSARYAETEAAVRTSNMRIAWRGASRGDEDGYALDILTDILAGSETSILNKRLVTEEKLCGSVFASHYNPMAQPSLFQIGISNFDYEDRDRILGIIDDEIGKIIEKGVDKKEVERQKRLLVKSLMFENETVEGQTSSMMFNYINYGRPTALDFLVPRYMVVEAGEIRAAAEKFLVPHTMNVVVVRPPMERAVDDVIAAKTSGGIDFEKRVLDNGITVLAAENNSVPHFDVKIFFNAGLRYDPKGKEGLTGMLADYLMEGIKGYPTQEKLSQYIDWNGYDVNSSGGNNSISLNGKLLPMDIEPGVELLARMAFEPTFPKESLPRLKQKKLIEIASTSNSWSREAFYYFREVFFVEHPYGHNTSGSEESIAAIARGDIIDFHDQFMRPSNCVIAIAGPQTVDESYELVERIFGDYKKSKIEVPKIAPQKPKTAPETHVKTSDRNQITLVIGYAAPSIYDDDRFALAVMKGFLSGMRGRLHEQLRGVRDLVYVVWGSSFIGPEAGTYYIMTQTSPENLDTVEAVILREIERVKAGDFGETELEQARANIREGFYRGRQEQENHVFSAALNELYGLGFDYEDRYLEKIEEVTLDDISRYANKYLVNPVTALVAPKSFQMETD